MSTNDSLPDDVETLQAACCCARDAELAQARAEASSAEALIAHLRLTIEKLRRDLFGPRNERKARLLDQMELQLEELEAAAAEDELAAEKAAAATDDTTQVRAFTPQAAGTQAVPGTSAARAGDRAGPDRLRLLRLDQARQARRGRDRDAGGDAAAMEGGAARAREVHLPGLREDQPGAGAVPRPAARLCRAEPAGDDPVREVRAASAAQSAIRALCPRGHRS